MIPVSFGLAIMVSNHHIGSNVEFPPIVKERTNDVLLHDNRSFLFLFCAFTYTLSNVLQLACAFDSVTSIAELSWL